MYSFNEIIKDILLTEGLNNFLYDEENGTYSSVVPPNFILSSLKAAYPRINYDMISKVLVTAEGRRMIEDDGGFRAEKFTITFMDEDKKVRRFTNCLAPSQLSQPSHTIKSSWIFIYFCHPH